MGNKKILLPLIIYLFICLLMMVLCLIITVILDMKGFVIMPHISAFFSGFMAYIFIDILISYLKSIKNDKKRFSGHN